MTRKQLEALKAANDRAYAALRAMKGVPQNDPAYQAALRACTETDKAVDAAWVTE